MQEWDCAKTARRDREFRRTTGDQGHELSGSLETTQLSPETAPFSPLSLKEKLRPNKAGGFVLLRKAEIKR